MSREAAFHRLLTARALDPAARGLIDDAAVLGDLVLTHDTLVEGVHCRLADPPESYGWKLAAANLSDLAAKGAEPLGCLLSYPLGEEAWNARFLDGLFACVDEYGMPLIGGDTVRLPEGSARVFGLTAIGRAPSGGAPSRARGRIGDTLWVSGPVGDAGWGLELLEGGVEMSRSSLPAPLLLRTQEPRGHPDEAAHQGAKPSSGLLRSQEQGGAQGEERSPPRTSAIAAYRFPRPHLALGRSIAGEVHAMMDLSDGLLIDAARLAAASGCGATITDVPVSPAWAAAHPPTDRLKAATAGDDYVLLFAAPERPAAAPEALPVGRLEQEPGLRLVLDGAPVVLPDSLGWEH